MPSGDQDVEFDFAVHGASQGQTLKCPKRAFAVVLGNLECLVLEEVYGGAAERCLVRAGRRVRSITFISNDQLSGHWIRVSCAEPVLDPG